MKKAERIALEKKYNKIKKLKSKKPRNKKRFRQLK